MSAAGIGDASRVGPIGRVFIPWNLSIPPLRVCRTVPRLATGILRFSYPQTLSGVASASRRMPVATLASASLPEDLGSAAVPTVSHRRRTVRHGFYRIPINTGSRYRAHNPAIPMAILGMLRLPDSVCRIQGHAIAERSEAHAPATAPKKGVTQRCGDTAPPLPLTAQLSFLERINEPVTITGWCLMQAHCTRHNAVNVRPVLSKQEGRCTQTVYRTSPDLQSVLQGQRFSGSGGFQTSLRLVPG